MPQNLFKSDWEKDVVYLVQFPRTGSVPSVSPFALKLETWLRMADINYKNVSNNFKRFSRKGQIPFVEYNGREIPDSNFVIAEVGEQLDKNLDAGLKGKEKADARAYHALVEDSLRWGLVYFRSKNIDFFATPAGFEGHLSGIKKFAFKNFLLSRFKKKINKMCKAQGIGRHTMDEVESMVKEDLKALSEYLGSKKYMTGDNPVKLDATAFGFLVQLYYAPTPTDAVKVFMREETKNLVEYVERIKKTYWPDWEDCIKQLSLDTDWKDEKYKAEKQ